VWNTLHAGAGKGRADSAVPAKAGTPQRGNAAGGYAGGWPAETGCGPIAYVIGYKTPVAARSFALAAPRLRAGIVLA